MGIALYCIPGSAQAEFINHTCAIQAVGFTVWVNPADSYDRQDVWVRCTAATATPDGGRRFVYKVWRTDNGVPEFAQMVLSILNAAKAAGKPVFITYESTDRTAEDDGCKFPVCRGFRTVRW